ncbi:3-deoxy-D-manno-octulosonic acid transferase [Plastorhodobacter daqingensis]|uniref:3-deoxy-D-manno-octulosonic acid transferase n=1 Tax=Plastorhodobacter daqingensis TaxID=1387281 RepID=A0ABW2UFH4_9RHOB
MTSADAPGRGALLRLWLGLSGIVAPVARWHLQQRVAWGKEDPLRVREKMGEPTLPRPSGPLVWLHAVGVGEVLALPALALAMQARRPGLHVLITSSSRSSAAALGPNLPAGVVHQFLPLDAAPFIRRFLDHWQPDLSVWAERDIWPALIEESFRRGIPLAIVNGRMNAASFRAKARAGALYRQLYGRFAYIGVQNPETRAHFLKLGVPAARLAVTGTLKAGAAPLADQPEARARIGAQLGDRPLWIAASSHPADEDMALAAQRLLLDQGKAPVLVIAPRDPGRADAIVAQATTAGFHVERIAPGNIVEQPADVLVLGEIGQLGLWYRLARAALVGGSVAPVGGHNPYEPARLDCAILHGPHIANFAEDYAAFHAADAARLVTDPPGLAAALCDPALAAMRPRAAEVASRGQAALGREAEKLLSLMAARLNRRD